MKLRDIEVGQRYAIGSVGTSAKDGPSGFYVRFYAEVVEVGVRHKAEVTPPGRFGCFQTYEKQKSNGVRLTDFRSAAALPSVGRDLVQSHEVLCLEHVHRSAMDEKERARQLASNHTTHVDDALNGLRSLGLDGRRVFVNGEAVIQLTLEQAVAIVTRISETEEPS